MPRITVHVSDDADEWLTNEKRRTGTSKAKLGGECIELIHSDVQHIEEARSDVLQTDSHLAERVDELEARLSEIEDAVNAPSEEDAEDDRAAASGGREESDDQSDTPEQKSHSGPRGASESDGDLDDILTGVYDGRERREARREAGRAALQWLREQDEYQSAKNFKKALHPEHSTNGESADTWWRKNARPAVQAAVDADLVDYRPGHHDYRWV